MTARPVAVVTAGGTREPLDEVRHLTNLASGALPCAMAEALLSRGWQVEYIHGPSAAIPGRPGVGIDLMSADWRARWQQQTRRLEQLALELRPGLLHLHPIQTAAEAVQTLAAVCGAAQPELTICAMAVADFAPEAAEGKLASRPGGAAGDTPPPLQLTLLPTAKAIDVVRREAPRTWLLGFKLLAGADEATLRQAALRLATRSGADAVFGNDVRAYQRGERKGVLWSRDGEVLDRPDCGQGPDATRRLAERLTALACDAVQSAGLATGAPTRAGLPSP